MNVKAISRNVGSALLISAAFMFLSMIVSIIYGKDTSFVPLAISFIITFSVGVFPFIFVRGSQSLSIKEGYVTILLSWLLSFVFGMLPYIMWGGEFTIANSWFESVSGYTTTGSTILQDIEALPNGLLFWRSSTHFIGGLGVVVFLLLILPEKSPFRRKLTNIEISSLSKEGYRYRSSRQVYIILAVYICIFIASAVSLIIAGMPVFDAINHAFSVTATGGFSIKNASIGFYNSTAINIIMMFFMLLSSMHFGLIYAAFVSRSLKPFKQQPVARYFLLCVLTFAIILTFVLKLGNGYSSWGKAAMDGAFSVISYFTTTGFAITDNSGWSALACAILMLAGLQCACSGSTTGGIKADRIYIAAKSIIRQIRINSHPSSIERVKVGNQVLPEDSVRSIMTYIVLYNTVVVVSIVLLMLFGVDVLDAFSGSVASVGNVGPGLRTIGTAGNYFAQPAVAKFIFSIDMVFGRLEIYPVLVVVSMIFRKGR